MATSQSPPFDIDPPRRSSYDVASDACVERKRLMQLKRYHVLDTEPERAFEDVTRLAARLFDVPIALVSLVDEHRQWFKSHLGIDAEETCLEASFCIYAIQSDSVMVVPDALEDPRFVHTPLVENPPHIRFYAGAPLETSEGTCLGTLCIIDTEPRTSFSDADRADLQRLASIVMDELELRREVAERAERERELKAAQDESEAARQKAERINDAMTQFFAGVTHDLRTPLTRIQLYTDLLERALNAPDISLEATGSEKVAGYLSTIHQAGDRIESLVQSLLELAWLRSGRASLDRSHENLVALVRDACADLSDASDASSHDVTVDVPDGPLHANVDPDALRRVLDNLLGNALKYTPTGTPVSARLYTARVVTGGGVHTFETNPEAPVMAVIEIADEGPGIAPEKLDTLFDPYTRVSTDVDGMGLGLSIVHDLVTAMDGAITVDSTVGQGTRFRIAFPLDDD